MAVMGVKTEEPDRTRERTSELRVLVSLAVPIITVQVGLMMMGVVDTMMVGRVSANDLAAVALGNLYVFGTLVGGMGVLMALDPVIAQAVGAGDEVGVARGVQRGLVIAAMVSVPVSLALIPGHTVLSWLGQPAEVVPIAARYALVSMAGTFPFYAFIVLRQSLQAMHRMRAIVTTIVVANLLNVVLNWALVFGHLGSPALGAVGTAWATLIARWLLLAGLLTGAWSTLAPVLLPARRDAIAMAPLWRMFKLGAPVGVQYQLEVGAFSVIALLMGWLGTREIAGHQIALNLASLSFMVPMGLSAAAAVRVGNAVGRGDPDGARRSAGLALRGGALMMCASGLLFLLAPRPLAALYTSEAEVASLAAILIPIAGFFQIFDGLQVVSVGVLRGLGETRSPMVVNMVGFWIVGLPLSWYLGFQAKAGAVGLWWGLVAALAAVAVFLLIRVRIRMARDMPRLVIDEEPGAI